MTVLLTLRPETVQILQEKAALAGQTLEAYLAVLAEREADAAKELPGVDDTTAPLSSDEWVARWYAWADTQRHQK